MRDIALLGLPSFLHSTLQAVPSWIPFVSSWRHRLAQECESRALDHYSAGEFDEAERYYRAAVQWAPQDPQLHSALGQVYYEQDKLDEAEEQFRGALEYDYSDSRALKGLGLVLQTKGNLQEAEGERQEAKGKLRKAKGTLQEAAYVYLRHLQRDDKDVDVLTNLGALHHNQGMYQQALDYYRRAEEIAPDDPVLRANSGRVLYDLGRFDEAVDSFKRARQLAPKDAEVHRLLGLALHARGDIQGALDSYTAATQQGSANALAHLDLSGLLSDMGKHKEALEQAKRSQAAFGEQGDEFGEAWAYGAAGWSYYCLGDFENSVQACRKALETDPELVHVRFHLALALLQLGDENEARAEYQASMDKAPPAGLKAHGADRLEEALSDRPDLPGGRDILRMLNDKYNSFEMTIDLGRKTEAAGDS